MFGVYELEQVVYGSRECQKIEYVPLDEQLQLPQSQFSYLLQDWSQSLAVEIPYQQVSVVLERVLGCSPSLNSLQRSNAKLSVSVPESWEARDSAPEAQGLHLFEQGAGEIKKTNIIALKNSLRHLFLCAQPDGLRPFWGSILGHFLKRLPDGFVPNETFCIRLFLTGCQ